MTLFDGTNLAFYFGPQVSLEASVMQPMVGEKTSFWSQKPLKLFHNTYWSHTQANYFFPQTIEDAKKRL